MCGTFASASFTNGDTGMSLQQAFDKAVQDVMKLRRRPSNDDMLVLYSLFKQASEGDVTGKRPGMLDITGRSKFDAWSRLKGTARDAAMQKYVDKVAALQKTHG